MKKNKPLRPVIVDPPLGNKDTFCVSCNAKLITVKQHPLYLYSKTPEGTLFEKDCPNGCKVVTGLEPTKEV